MKGRKLSSIALLSMTLFVALMVLSVRATEVETVFIDVDGENVLVLNLNQGDRVHGSFSISGTGIRFSVKDPYGDFVVDEAYVQSGTTFEITAEKSGAYTLIFENTSRRNTKVVTVSYDVELEFFSNPFLLIGVVLVIILIAVVGVSVSLRRRKSENESSKN